jgi:DNA polymerase-3 subunit alpha
VLRDVGRVLQMPYGQVDRLCKMVPQNPANPVTLAKAIEGEPRFAGRGDEKEPVVQTLLDIAQKLEGLYRHASTHAAGIVIGDRPLSELVPMYRDPRSDMPVTQFNMKWSSGRPGEVRLPRPEDADRARNGGEADPPARHRDRSEAAARRPEDLRDAVARRGGRRVPGGKRGHAQGADRHEARPHRGHHRAGGALPPGPMENIPTYNARKHGEEEIASIHPKIDHLVKET